MKKTRERKRVTFMSGAFIICIAAFFLSAPGSQAASKEKNALKPVLVKAYEQYLKSIKNKNLEYLKRIMPPENYKNLEATPEKDIDKAFAVLQWLAEDIDELKFVHLENTDSEARYYFYRVLKSKGDTWLRAGYLKFVFHENLEEWVFRRSNVYSKELGGNPEDEALKIFVRNDKYHFGSFPSEAQKDKYK